jgi:hypothetical protein
MRDDAGSPDGIPQVSLLVRVVARADRNAFDELDFGVGPG